MITLFIIKHDFVKLEIYNVNKSTSSLEMEVVFTDGVKMFTGQAQSEAGVHSVQVGRCRTRVRGPGRRCACRWIVSADAEKHQ